MQHLIHVRTKSTLSSYTGTPLYTDLDNTSLKYTKQINSTHETTSTE